MLPFWYFPALYKIFIAREIMHKSPKYQISRNWSVHYFKIWFSILFCLYLGYLISYRKVFVLHMELWIPPSTWNMPQPSNIFVGREIKQNRGRSFLIHPVLFTIYETQKWHFFKKSFFILSISFSTLNHKIKIPQSGICPALCVLCQCASR